MKAFLTLTLLSFSSLVLAVAPAQKVETTYDQKSNTLMHAQIIGNGGHLRCADMAGNGYEAQVEIKSKGFNYKTPALSITTDGQTYSILNIDLSFLSTLKVRKYDVKISTPKGAVELYCRSQR